MSSNQLSEQASGLRTFDLPFTTLITLCLLLLSTLPHLYGWLSTPPGAHYMGLANLDVNTYYSWMRQAADGHFLWQDQFTNEPHRALFFDLLWAILGIASRWVPADIVYAIFRLLAQVLFIFTFAYCASFYIRRTSQRRLALLLACFNSGLLWLVLGGNWVFRHLFGASLAPLEVPQEYIIGGDGATFNAAIFFPHLLVACSLITIIMTLGYRGLNSGRWRLVLLAGSASLLLGFCHIYDLLTVYMALGLFAGLLVLRGGKAWRTLLAQYAALVLLSSPPLFYYGVIFTQSAVFQFWAAHNQLPTPNPVWLVLFLGLLLLIPLLGYRGLAPLIQRSPSELMLISWVATTMSLITFPLIRFQGHLLNGVQVPLALSTAVIYLEHIIPAIQRQIRQRRATGTEEEDSFSALLATRLSLALLVLLVVLALPMNGIVLTGITKAISSHNSNYYLTRDELSALTWLGKHGNSTSVVLAPLDLAGYVPRLSGLKVLAGHPALTVNYYTKVVLLNQFYDPATTDEVRQRWLRQYTVRFVLLGPAQVHQGPGTGYFGERPYLTRVFSTASVEVYEVYLT